MLGLSLTKQTANYRQRLPALASVLCVALLVWAVPANWRPAQAFADVITNPTHIIDDQWNLPYTGGNDYSLTSLSTDMTPETDGTPDGYFYASNFYFSGASAGVPATALGYMGLQDEGNDGQGHILAKTASITIYGATLSTPASGAAGGCGNPSGEGQQCNLRVVYTWVPNHTYRFSLALQTANNGKGSEIWTAKFSDITTGASHQFGTLQVPTSWQYLSHAVVTFHERFSGPTNSCSSIKTSFVKFSNVTTSNGAIAGVASTAYDTGVNTAACPGYLYNNVSNNIVSSGYGPNIASFIPAPAAPPAPPASTPPPATTKTTQQVATTSTPQPTTTAPISNSPAKTTARNTQPVTRAPQTVSTAANHTTMRMLYVNIGALVITALITMVIVRSSLAKQ